MAVTIIILMAKLNIIILCVTSGFLLTTPLVAEDTAVFSTGTEAQIELGQLLFYDPILSGNRNTSCATCHHPKFGTSDGVSLALGEGGIGLGPDRHADPTNPPEQRIGRNAPALFNLGAAEFTTMFHGGRLEIDKTRASGIRTPLEDSMALGFDNVLSAQAMFPVLSGDEMAGQYSENDISKAVRLGFLTQKGGAWDIIAARIEGIAEYRARFNDVIGPREIKFTDISNMIAAFISHEWRADNSAYDQYLAGQPLPELAEAGRLLFYGNAGCMACHSGRFQTDHGFHAIAMPQFGPGKAARFEDHQRDVGRMRVTGNSAAAYAFRTPSLRNITETGPYGHTGAFATLEAVVRHHLDPVASLYNYDRSQAILPKLEGVQDWAILDNPAEMAAIAAANVLKPVSLTDTEVEALLAFLAALNDKGSLQGRLGIPAHVPSGLTVD